jgi:hypothetical protein
VSPRPVDCRSRQPKSRLSSLASSPAFLGWRVDACRAVIAAALSLMIDEDYRTSENDNNKTKTILFLTVILP